MDIAERTPKRKPSYQVRCKKFVTHIHNDAEWQSIIWKCSALCQE